MSCSLGQANLGRDRCFVAFEHAPPAQIVFQVLGGHAVKAVHPAFEATVVGIDVLDVKHTVDDPWAMLDVERQVGNPGGAGKSGINAGTVGAQYCFLVDQWSKCRDRVGCIEFSNLKSAACPLRSCTTSAGVCSALRPRLPAAPPGDGLAGAGGADL